MLRGARFAILCSPQAKEYVARVNPFLINDLEKQAILRDRRSVYEMLLKNDIPVPRHIVVTADREPRAAELTWDEVALDDDKLILKSTGEVLLTKPFVEKPCDADDHNVYVYFAVADGGGERRAAGCVRRVLIPVLSIQGLFNLWAAHSRHGTRAPGSSADVWWLP